MADRRDLFGNAPGLVCGWWPSGPTHCGAPATVHVIWTEDMDNGLACDAHEPVHGAPGPHVAVHPYDPTCSVPGAEWLPDENRCVVPDEVLGLDAVTFIKEPTDAAR